VILDYPFSRSTCAPFCLLFSQQVNELCCVSPDFALIFSFPQLTFFPLLILFLDSQSDVFSSQQILVYSGESLFRFTLALFFPPIMESNSALSFFLLVLFACPSFFGLLWPFTFREMDPHSRQLVRFSFASYPPPISHLSVYDF